MQQPLQPQPSALPPTTDLILHHYLAEALTIQQIAGALKLSIPAVLDVIQSPRTHAIISQLRDAELQRQELLRTIAVSRALHTLTALTDPEVCGTDRSLELQRKASSALLREAASTARIAALRAAPRATRAPHIATIASASPASPTPTQAPAPTSARRENLRCNPNRVAPRHAHESRSHQQRTQHRSLSANSSSSGRLFAPQNAPRRAIGRTPRLCQHVPAPTRAPSRRNHLRRPIRSTHGAPRARSPPEHAGKARKTSMFDISHFFLPLCWHRAVLEACSAWSDRIARSWGFGSCCAAPRTWSAFSKGREVRCEECSPDLGRGRNARARWRSSG